MSNISHAQIEKNPAQIITAEIEAFVLNDPSCRLSFMNDYVMWEKPLVEFADGDDPLFTEYKKIIGPVHLTPREAMAQGCNLSPADLPERISVISWVLPVAAETRQSNRSQTLVPGRLWSHTRWYGEKSNDMLRRHMVAYLAARGFLAVAPILQPFFKLERNEKGEYSNWSERHIAYAAGQGTFSLSDGFITRRGIAHRCGSVVTSLVIPATPRKFEGPFSNCLHYQGIDCRGCIKRCPAGAISEDGHDKFKCMKYLVSIGYSPQQLKSSYDNEKSVVGCGFCQTGVPCEFKIPVKAGQD
jgi:epoxyqueuosine reductase